MINHLLKELVYIFRKNINLRRLNLHEPSIHKNDLYYLKKCIYLNQIALGGFIKKFEKKLSSITKSKYVITTNSGISALHIACLLLGTKKNDEVLVPSFTFVATANAVKYCGAVPHFIDIEDKNFGINIPKLEKYLEKNTFIKNKHCINKKTGRIIKGIIPVHIFGHPVQMDKLVILARKFKLFVLEDSAESLGSKYKGKHTGTFGDIGILSFNGNKIITTGSGGAILTKKKELADQARHLISNAKVKGFGYLHDGLGYNYKMANINAAIGLSQIIKIKKFLKNKRKIFHLYKKLFSKSKFFKLVEEPKNCNSNYWLQTILIKEKYSKSVNILIKKLNEKKINVRPGWKLLPELNHLKKCPSMDLSISKKVTKRIINIPSSSFLINYLK
tara:strand:+ start:25241 stop:26407 length:1167 start_codon:yes stop_codon:yes gene_type:complete